jgi:lipopolysaccharide transport system ATP-binding protein
MMPIVQATNLGKTYRRGETFGNSLSERLAHGIFGLGRRRQDTTAVGACEIPEEFWALKEINFEIGKGEVVGIVGRNGAGKSTLLKILSRITAPSAGCASIKGRVASLLEIGTGFHPELTGRENIFLNGTVLGLKREEIHRKLDEIVEFAELAKFLDTPVKRYSSGMYLRLAFAVAASLEAEVLLIDEILAVGDASFQKRCLGKMDEMSKHGRTVLFVSHNMASLQGLCSRGLYLDDGRLITDASIAEAIRKYMEALNRTASGSLKERKDRVGDGRLRFTNFWVEDQNGAKIDRLLLGDTVTICFSYEAEGSLEDVYVAFDLCEQAGYPLINCNTADVGFDFDTIPRTGVFRCQIPRLPLRGGSYIGNLYCAAKGNVCDWIQNAIRLDLEDGDFFGTGKLRNRSKFVLPHTWSVEEFYWCSELDSGDSPRSDCSRDDIAVT